MNEVPLFPWWVSVFLTIWGVVGPIVGLAFGNYLSVSAQRTRWIADNQKEEYRNLLAALNRLHMALTAYHVTGNADNDELKRAVEEISTTSNTSLFISDFLKNTRALGDVQDASRAFVQAGSFDKYLELYWKAVNQILDSAKKIKP